MFRLIVLIFLALACQAASGEPLTLKCWLPDGKPTGDLVIDLDKKTMKWAGVLEYKIEKLTPEYITAIQESYQTEVGSEIFVINRATGDYQRASVAIKYSGVAAYEKGDGRFSADTYAGRCAKQIL